MKRVILSAALVCLAGLGAYAQKRLPYRDASLLSSSALTTCYRA